jgi:hypothetical protein
MLYVKLLSSFYLLKCDMSYKITMAPFDKGLGFDFFFFKIKITSKHSQLFISHQTLFITIQIKNSLKNKTCSLFHTKKFTIFFLLYSTLKFKNPQSNPTFCQTHTIRFIMDHY